MHGAGVCPCISLSGACAGTAGGLAVEFGDASWQNALLFQVNGEEFTDELSVARPVTAGIAGSNTP